MKSENNKSEPIKSEIMMRKVFKIYMVNRTHEWESAPENNHFV